MFVIDTDQSFKELSEMLSNGEAKLLSIVDNVLDVEIGKDKIKIELAAAYKDKFAPKHNSLMFGKDTTKGVINISVKDDTVHIFRKENGELKHETRPFKKWVLSPKDYNGFSKLKGPEYYKYIKLFSPEEFNGIRPKIYQKDLYTIWHDTENFMVYSGMTYFKDMKLTDLSMLSFDIETTGLTKEAKDAEVLLITNTFREGEKSTKKTFNIENYDNQGEMIDSWCKWVQEVNPDLFVGHNIVIYDLPYLNYQYNKFYKTTLPLGRNNSNLEFAEKTSELRKDGSQSYSYHKISCFGRDIIDTFFLAIKVDIARKYESYALKSIIRQEGLEKEGRTFVDASKIKQYYLNRDNDRDMWEKVIAYAEDDSDDALKLMDLMVTPIFYFTPHIPKTFQQMMETATGSQLNSFMVRSYLQDGFSVAKGNASTEFEGAISFGNMGVYSHCQKWDIASLYPSIMRLYKITPGKKDYNNNFLQMLEYFTLERLKNKKLAKDTGDRFYKDLEQMQKIGINSAYGFLGAKGLNYNNPEGAALVTRKGREIITKAIQWAEAKNFKIVNCDTDSITISDGVERPKEAWTSLMEELNSTYDPMIRFEDDGTFTKVIIFKAKNYVLYDGKKIKLKGSALKDQKKEPALREMIGEVIKCLIEDRAQDVIHIYEKYIKEAFSPQDIRRWASKKTVTKAILNCATDPTARLNERNVYDAIKDKVVQEGDKIYIYPAVIAMDVQTTILKNGKVKEKVVKTTGLKCVEDYKGDRDEEKLIERVYKTLQILEIENVIDIKNFINYTLVKNKPLVENLVYGKTV